jgi:hypothetical protein
MRMRVRRVVLVVLPVVVLGASVLGPSGAASAKNAPGSPKWCRHHPKSSLAACHQTTGPPPASHITVSPNPIVETGGSDVYAVITVSSDPAYAEQTVEVISALGNRCGRGVMWSTNQGTFTGSTATATIDDDGNATFVLLGGSCAAGTVQVIADVLAGTHPTYTATFTIAPPAPSI